MPPTHCAVPGTLLNANTLDDFKERDKAALLQGVGGEHGELLQRPHQA